MMNRRELLASLAALGVVAMPTTATGQTRPLNILWRNAWAIVNIGDWAVERPYRDYSAYFASKGVNVTAVCPGFTYSEFHDVTGTRDKMNKVPGMLWLTAKDVAQEGYDAVMRGDPVVVNGRIYRLLVWLNGAMPRSVSRWVSGLAGRRYRKT